MPVLKTIRDSRGPVPEGMDAATPPSANAMRYRSALAVNVSHRRGYAHPRPAWISHRTIMTSDVSAAVDAFQGGIFQGASVYYPERGAPRLVVGIGGWHYSIDTEDWSVRLLTPDGKRWRSDLRQWWAAQAGRYMVIMNGADPTIIYDGTTARFPKPDEIKVGVCPVYAAGRFWYATPDRLALRATDLMWENGNPEDILKETSNTLLTSGDFPVPSGLGRVTAIVAPAQLDSALGHGPVHVFCERGVFTNNAPVDRDTWLSLRYPIQTISLIGDGPLSSASVVNVNGDIFYRSRNGVESYILARRNFTEWGNRPVSREVGLWLLGDNPRWLNQCSAAFWNQRLLVTAVPRMSYQYGVLFRGVVVLDFDVHATLKETLPPAWDGFWVGPDLHHILNVQGRLLAIGVDPAGVRTVYELVENAADDVLAADPFQTKVPIRWLIEYSQMDFGDSNLPKRLLGAEVYLDKIAGTTQFDLNLKVDESPVELDWANWTETVNLESTPSNCSAPENRHPGYRFRRSIPAPPTSCKSGRPANVAFRFQPVLRVSGQAEIRGLVLHGVPVDETADSIHREGSVGVETGCLIDPLTP